MSSHLSLAKKPAVVVLFLVVVFAVLWGQVFHLIQRYAVNLLYSDQWYFYTPFFQQADLWQIFSWQHGPHRQGIGLVVTGWLAELTRWDSRADAWAVGGLMGLAAGLALWLKYRLFGSWSFSDAMIPLLFFSLFHYESFIGVPNLSYGAFPMVLMLLYAQALFIQRLVWRYAVLTGLNFLLIYTGFGVFMGLVSLGVLGLDVMQHRHDRPNLLVRLGALAVAGLSGLSFFVGYTFNPAIPNFTASVAFAPDYAVFVGLMLSAFWGWHSLVLGEALAAVAGLGLLVVLMAVAGWHAHKLLKHGLYTHPLSLVVVVFIGFSLLFCLNTAVGRLPLGLRYAQVSRYLTLLIPAFLALYLHLLSLNPGRLSQSLKLAYLTMALVGCLPLGVVDRLAETFYADKTAWATCYLQRQDVTECTRLTNNPVFALADPADLAWKLRYLQEHHLNLYAPE